MPPDALSAAVRSLLSAGRAVRLEGLGTLRRVHEPARVEVRPDGSRVLHPPRHGVRFEPEAPDGPPDGPPAAGGPA
jgi:nucleoid DNA-binding protein